MGKLKPAFLSMVLAAVASFAPSRALAEPAAAAALLRFEVQGKADPDRVLEKVASEALGSAITLVDVKRVDTLLDTEPAFRKCTETACLMQFGKEIGARFVVRGTARFDGSDYQLLLGADDVATGKPMKPEKVSCVLCGWTEVQEKLAYMARTLGARAAVEPLPVVLPEVPPKKIKPARPPFCPSAKCTILKWATGVAAVGLLGTGGVMLGVDGRCSFDIPPAAVPGAFCPRPYDSVLAGSITVGVGAVLAGASATFFVLDRAPRLVPKVSADTRGASLSLVGTF